MGLFKHIKNWIQSRSANSKPTRPAELERLEPRILLSADGLLGITIPETLVDNTEQVIQYELLQTNDASQQESSLNAMIEQTELVIYDSNPVESDTLELSGQGLQFNLVPAAGMSQQAIDAFQEAADILSAMFTDDIVVNISINFKTLSSGILGQSSFMLQLNTYSEVYTALLNDQTSSSDNVATNFLPTGSSLAVYINLTSDNPNGSGSITPYLDNNGDENNYRIRITTANAKALGLRTAGNTATDASITFSDQYSWDFDRSDGITPGSFDFVGIAIHEIVHAMGFTSGVDYLDENPMHFEYNYTHISTLDLYRYSSNSISAGADIDWTADTRTKFFSIDGGMTNLATFSTGINYGDGRQASHWKDHLNLGIMDPTAAPGEFMDITAVDVIAWDVIGWDLSSMYLIVQDIPYNQDFSSGLPDAVGGWEYYSSNDGRIQVIDGRLRMDDSVGDGTYSLNEAILHLNLTGQTDVNLSLDHYSIFDENHSMPANFTGHADGDGIAISIDGTNWIKISDLTGSSHISLDLNLVGLFGAGADLSDVRIKFQQYDNWPSPTDDGREFDNIQVHEKIFFDLNTWTENLIADDTAGGGFVINSTTSAETISGGLTRAVLFSGTNDVGYMLEGQFKVKTTFDDDFIGFVIGYNNNDYVSGSADYILIDWKQAGTHRISPFDCFGRCRW